MDSNRLRQLVWEPEETAKLDFKIEFYKIKEPRPSTKTDEKEWAADKEKQWAELVKDVIALTNGNIGTAEETGYLIVGAKDELKADGTPTLRDVGNMVPLRKQVLQKVNSYCDPKLPDLHCDQIEVDGVNLFVISIPPSPHLHRISRQLITPKKEYSPYTVLIRSGDGETTYEASPADQTAIKREKEAINRLSIEEINETEGLFHSHIQLDRNLGEAVKVSKQELKIKARHGRYLKIGTFLFIMILFVPSFSPLNSFVLVFYLFSLVAIFISFVYFLRPYLRSYSEAMNLYRKRPRSLKEAKFVGEGRLMEDNNEGSYLIYKPTASCIYPYCKENGGQIFLDDAPPREVLKHGKIFLVGICSLAGNDHSYKIDHILVATPKEFDWRDLDKT